MKTACVNECISNCCIDVVAPRHSPAYYCRYHNPFIQTDKKKRCRITEATFFLSVFTQCYIATFLTQPEPPFTIRIPFGSP